MGVDCPCTIAELCIINSTNKCPLTPHKPVLDEGADPGPSTEPWSQGLTRVSRGRQRRRGRTQKETESRETRVCEAATLPYVPCYLQPS